ncbi:serine O-acetyltransferase EpsC [Salmonirosea aquatica]|uniref:Serine acetyltransferase n=1 Tax=Salmonirosea aquatica TaxID=2654236 RepID=A0A7C9BLS7_9BACT|nr:serine acetyltransferase [Cytophagaceae bacterium SJW1-29]
MNHEQKTTFLQRISEQNNTYRFRLPCRHETGRFLHNLLDFLFPLSQDCPDFGKMENQSARFDEIQVQLDNLLIPLEDKLPSTRKQVTEDFFTQLPGIFELFLSDAKAIAENDPAAVGIEEVIAVYPGFMAICAYRIAHLLAQCKVPLLPRMITEYAHGATGIDIHPNAVIGHSFFIDHGTGVVIGETAHIGDHVMIYQGVTLGASHVAKSLASVKRHPTIEDRVVIYANATILGGNTRIGEGSVIGGNAWVTHSVPAYSQVYHQSKVEIKQQMA